MIINNGPIGSGKFNPEEDILFSYSIVENNTTMENQSLSTAQDAGICEFSVSQSNNNNWDLKILKNCSIKLQKNTTIKSILLVGGGGKGATGTQTGTLTDNNSKWTHWKGGNGGYGGDILQLYNIKFLKNINIDLTIGKGLTKTCSSTSRPDKGTTKIEVEQIQISYQAHSGYTSLSENDTESRGYGIGGSPAAFKKSGWEGESHSTDSTGIEGYYYHENFYAAGGGGGGATIETAAQKFQYQGAIGGNGIGGIGHGISKKAMDELGLNISTTDGYTNTATAGAINTGSGGGGGRGASYYGQCSAGANGGSGIIILSNYE